MTWAAKMAIETGTGVPWVMCKEEDAPDPVVSPHNYFSGRSIFYFTLFFHLINNPKRVIFSLCFN